MKKHFLITILYLILSGCETTDTVSYENPPLQDPSYAPALDPQRSREEESRRSQTQPPQEEEHNNSYNDNDYRIAGSIAMELQRTYGRSPSQDELITTWQNRIGITQAQARRLYNDMFCG